MPLPIVHLGVAKEMIEKLSITNIPAYYLCSISPDAVHMRDNFKREDKQISHLHNTDIKIWKENSKNFILDNWYERKLRLLLRLRYPYFNRYLLE